MRRVAGVVLLVGAMAQASDYHSVVVRDGGADPSWPFPAIVRYDLHTLRGEALKQCYRSRNDAGEVQVTFELNPSGVSNFRVVEGKEGKFSKCLEAVLLTLPTRTDGGSETISLRFGGAS